MIVSMATSAAFICLMVATVTKASPLTGQKAGACLDAHNLYRRLHPETDDLEWDSGLARDAQVWAAHLLSKNMFNHDPGNKRRKQGENLYTFYGPIVMTCAHAVKDWYEEVHDYDFVRGAAKNSFKTLIEAKDNNVTTVEKRGKRKKMIGHFTQIVWKDTSKLGVAIASKFVKEQSGIKYFKSYVVARYKTPGNFQNQYTENVLGGPPVDLPELHELDPATCKNGLSESKCQQLEGQFGCKSSAWRCFMLAGCYKMCTTCERDV